MPVQTRSMTKTAMSLSVKKERNVKSKPKAPKTPKVRILKLVDQNINNNKICTEVIMASSSGVTKPTKPLADILSESELNAAGLTTNQSINGWRKVIPAIELELLVIVDKDIRGKWAVAPDGWYWKAYSEKCYYWFDWFELEPIPRK